MVLRLKPPFREAELPTTPPLLLLGTGFLSAGRAWEAGGQATGSASASVGSPLSQLPLGAQPPRPPKRCWGVRGGKGLESPPGGLTSPAGPPS